MSWLIPREELSTDQIRAIELRPTQHRLILGAPGSGKTQVLLHRARHLLETGAGTKEHFHIFVFNNVLKDYIRSGLADLELPESCVTTLDHWCRTFYESNISRRLPWDKENKCPDFAQTRNGVFKKIAGGVPLYDFVLADEGQDLEPDSFALLRQMARHVTVCMDHKQQIYDRGSTEADIVKALGLRRSDMILLDAFRCCPYIVNLAAEFIPDFAEREAFKNQTRTVQTEIETPLLFESTDWEEERDRLESVLRERLMVDKSIGILLPQNRQVEGFAKGLRESGLEVETQKSTGLHFGTSLPKVLTYHSAKGLTFETVLLPRLVAKSFPRASPERLERLLYVGITRAIKWVYLSTNTSTPVESLEKVRRLGEPIRPRLRFR